MRDPQFCPEPQVQLELRHLRARKEPMRVDAIGKGPIGMLFSVQSASERRYEVEIRDPGHRINTCTCPERSFTSTDSAARSPFTRRMRAASRALLDRALSSLAWAQGFEAEEAVSSALAAELLEEVSGIVRAIHAVK